MRRWAPGLFLFACLRKATAFDHVENHNGLSPASTHSPMNLIEGSERPYTDTPDTGTEPLHPVIPRNALVDPRSLPKRRESR